MIEDGGLTIVATDNNVPERTKQDRFYFMLIMRKGDTPPAWVEGTCNCSQRYMRNVRRLDDRRPLVSSFA